MKKREKYENGILSVRFTGEHLSEHGVSIYDLGETLLAIQRIVHKAYLAQKGRLVKGAFPDKGERTHLALQLGERKRGSDAFALVPLLGDRVLQESLKQLVRFVISGVVAYYVRDVLDRVRGENNKDKQIFIGSIYSEVVNIVHRIDASGGVESISIGSPALNRETFAAFTNKTKDYLVKLQGETYLGTYQEIKGKVYKLYPVSKIVAIRRAGGRTVSIFLNETDFDQIRYHRETNPLFLFKGHPKYRFGIETETVSEFDADEIEYIGEDD
ncbi:MAG: hypothetical protein ACLQVJ_08575 [Syntrophobacteraceae bacterium]